MNSFQRPVPGCIRREWEIQQGFEMEQDWPSLCLKALVSELEFENLHFPEVLMTAQDLSEFPRSPLGLFQSQVQANQPLAQPGRSVAVGMLKPSLMER